MTQALLYTELQIAAQIADAPWRDINARIKTKPCLAPFLCTTVM